MELGLDVFAPQPSSGEDARVQGAEHDDDVAARMQRMVHLRDGRVGEEATAAGRWSVVGTDGSLQLPQALRTEWTDGTLVSVEEVAPGELRIRRSDGGGGDD